MELSRIFIDEDVQDPNYFENTIDKLLAWNKANVIQAQQQLIERVKLHRDNPNWTAKAQRIANEQIDYIVSDLADRIAELNKEGEVNGNR